MNEVFFIVGEDVHVGGSARFKPTSQYDQRILHIPSPGQSCLVRDFRLTWEEAGKDGNILLLIEQPTVPDAVPIRTWASRGKRIVLAEDLVLHVEEDGVDAKIHVSRFLNAIANVDRTYYLVTGGAPEWSHLHGGIVTRVPEGEDGFIAVAPGAKFEHRGCSFSRVDTFVNVVYPDGTRFMLYESGVPCIHLGLTFNLFHTREEAQRALVRG